MRRQFSLTGVLLVGFLGAVAVKASAAATYDSLQSPDQLQSRLDVAAAMLRKLAEDVECFNESLHPPRESPINFNDRIVNIDSAISRLQAKLLDPEWSSRGENKIDEDMTQIERELKAFRCSFIQVQLEEGR